MKRVCQQWEMHLLVLIFGSRQRKMCLEERKGVSNGNISTSRQGRAAEIIQEVFGGVVQFLFLFVSHVLNTFGLQVG